MSVKKNSHVLSVFGYQSGDVETFLKPFGLDPKKETAAAFCKRHWNIVLPAKAKAKKK
jgi:hypothetical protein